MALVFKVVAVPDRRTQTDGPDIIGFENGLVFVDTHAYDTLNPTAILAVGTHNLPSTMTDQQILDHITAYYRRMKQANDRRNALVPRVGTTFPIT